MSIVGNVRMGTLLRIHTEPPRRAYWGRYWDCFWLSENSRTSADWMLCTWLRQASFLTKHQNQQTMSDLSHTPKNYLTGNISCCILSRNLNLIQVVLKEHDQGCDNSQVGWGRTPQARDHLWARLKGVTSPCRTSILFMLAQWNISQTDLTLSTWEL